MARVTTHECDLCKAEIKDTEKAGIFAITPPLPEELREFKDERGGGADPKKLMKLMMNPDPVRIQRLTELADDHMKKTEKYELCSECADFTLGTIKQMKGLQSLVEAGAKAH